MVTIVSLKFAMSSHFPLPKKVALFVPTLSRMARAARRVIENSRQMIKFCPVYYRKRVRAAYFVREVHSVRERDRACPKCAPYFGRRVLRFSLLKNLHVRFSPLEWRWLHTFRCQKRCTFRNSSHTSYCQMAWLTGDRSSKANDRISGCTVLLSRRKNRKNEPNLYQQTIGNRKRDCAWVCAWGINTTWENLQIEKHKTGRRTFRSPNWFVLFDLQIFSGGVYSPSATSRTISFSTSNSFWY